MIIDELPAAGDLGFGKYFASEMVHARYANGRWEPWSIKPASSFTLPPTSKVLHYAQEIFEGLKAFRLENGQTALFRPLENVRRMARSSEIMAMPVYPEADYLASMRELVRRCSKLVPALPGALYLRPTMIAIDSTLGVAPALEYDFFILASPVGGYFGSTKSDKPATVKVLATDAFVRAAPRGVGAAKTGANYAASLRAVSEAKKKGFDNVLFLDAIQHENLEELSGMNVFVVEDGTLKTPRLGDTILAGITRDSILKLAAKRGLKTLETDISIHHLIEGFKSGRVSEMFACGTGASITAIGGMGWKGETVKIGGGDPGPVTTALYQELLAVQAGTKPSDDGWLVTC